MEKRKIIIFASGSGSNAENFVNFSRTEDSLFEVVSILCNKPDAYVLCRAERLGVPSLTFTPTQLRNNLITVSGKEISFTGYLKESGADILVLAGFLLKIPDYMIEEFSGRIVNVHPALLPAYGGKGMYGEHVHMAVIAAGEKKSGITIHLVDNKYDHGAILRQFECEVKGDDTPETLAARIHTLESQYPSVVNSYIKEIFR